MRVFLNEFFFRGRFLGRVRVFLNEFFFSWTLSWTSACLRACFLARVLFCVDAFLYECVFACTSACFLDRVLFLRGRVRVYLLVHFLFFFYKFPALVSRKNKNWVLSIDSLLKRIYHEFLALFLSDNKQTSIQ